MADYYSYGDSEAIKNACITKFTEWWSTSDLCAVIEMINPKIFRMIIQRGTIDNKQRVAEILYDMVGPHFLKNVENDSEKRRIFLGLILEAATGNGQTTKKKIMRIASESARADQKNSIGELYDILNLTMTARLTRNLATELGLPPQVAEAERSDKPPSTEIIVPHSALNPLYDYQYTTTRIIRRMLEGKEVDANDKKVLRKMVSVPTGAGKTRLITETIIEWFNDGNISENKQQRNSKFVLWVAQSNELCEQAFSTFKNVFESAGKPGTTLHMHRFWGTKGVLPNLEMDELLSEKGVIVATIQSLYKLLDTGLLESLAEITSCIIVDEAHHATASSYAAVLRKMGFNWDNRKAEISTKGIVLIGLTATPFRGTGLGSDTERLTRWFNHVYIPDIPYIEGIKNFKPHAIIDCQAHVYTNQYVNILGERSYDRDGYIDDKDYFWRITRWNESAEEADDNVWVFEKQKNIEFKPERSGEYQVTLKVIDNDGDYGIATDQMIVYERPGAANESLHVHQKNLYEKLTKKDILCKVYHLVIKSDKYNISKQEIEHIKMWGEFSKDTLKSVEDDDRRNTKIVEEISTLNEMGIKKILFFGCSVNHSRMISILLKTKYGIKSEYIDSRVGIGARVAAIERFKTGDLDVLCNFNVLTAGFDAPAIDCVFVGRPVRSTLLYTQIIGRGMRGIKTGGTERMLLVDIDDNFQLKSGRELEITKLGWKTFSSYWTYIKNRFGFPGIKRPTMEQPTMEQPTMEQPTMENNPEPTENDEGLSHICSECKTEAVSLGQIETIFGVVGEAELLIASLKTDGHPGIPEKCQTCRGVKSVHVPKPKAHPPQTLDKPIEPLMEQTDIDKPKEITESDIDNEFNHLKDNIYSHIPTSRQFWERSSLDIQNAINELYGGYSKYVKNKGLSIKGDHVLEDRLYDEYFELYTKINGQTDVDIPPSARDIHKFGKYHIDDYNECFGSFNGFKRIVDRIIKQMNKINKNASMEELLEDYNKIEKKCMHPPHFEDVRVMSKIGIAYYLNVFGSLGRFRQIRNIHNKNTIL